MLNRPTIGRKADVTGSGFGTVVSYDELFGYIIPGQYELKVL
jgi:hypothetical protein